MTSPSSMKLAPASCCLRIETICDSLKRDFRLLAGKPTVSSGPDYRGNVGRFKAQKCEKREQYHARLFHNFKPLSREIEKSLTGSFLKWWAVEGLNF